MRMRWVSTFVLVAALAAGGAAHALPIALGAHDRTVDVEASASSPVGADAVVDGDTGPPTGTASLDRTAFAEVAGDPSTPTGVGEATQASELSTAALSGAGTAGASATARAADSFAQGLGESLYRIEFTATADAMLRLAGSVAASASGASDALSIVELASLDSTLDPLLLHFEAAPGETLPFDVGALLHAGLGYRLTALARTNADALDDEKSLSTGDWSFALTAVPEPGTALLFAAGLVALGGRLRR
jgi:hypothetical protein